jgi:hypothetical protein
LILTGQLEPNHWLREALQTIKLKKNLKLFGIYLINKKLAKALQSLL